MPALKEADPLPRAEVFCVLLLDWDLLFAEFIASRLRITGIEAFTASSPIEAIPLLKSQKIAVVVSTQRGFLDFVRETRKDVRTLLLAEFIDAAQVLEAHGHRVLSRDMDRSFIADVIRAEVRRAAQ